MPKKHYVDYLDNNLRLRTFLSVKKGKIYSFCIQLEWVEWKTYPFGIEEEIESIVRFDHESGGKHDVEVEGLHMDIYKKGKNRKYKVEEKFPRKSLNEYPKYCILYVQDNIKSILRRFLQ